MKSAREVAEEIEQIVENRALPVFFTMSWPHFLEKCGRTKWHDSFALELQTEALNRGFIIGYGNEVVFVAADAMVWGISDADIN